VKKNFEVDYEYLLSKYFDSSFPDFIPSQKLTNNKLYYFR